jgi:hypothetical protein
VQVLDWRHRGFHSLLEGPHEVGPAASPPVQQRVYGRSLGGVRPSVSVRIAAMDLERTGTVANMGLPNLECDVLPYR